MLTFAVCRQYLPSAHIARRERESAARNGWAMIYINDHHDGVVMMMVPAWEIGSDVNLPPQSVYGPYMHALEWCPSGASSRIDPIAFERLSTIIYTYIERCSENTGQKRRRFCVRHRLWWDFSRCGFTRVLRRKWFFCHWKLRAPSIKGARTQKAATISPFRFEHAIKIWFQCI